MKDTEKNLKARKNKHITCEETFIGYQRISQQRLCRPEREGWYIQSIERKIYQPRILYLAKLSFRSEVVRRTFPDKQKLREFMMTKLQFSLVAQSCLTLCDPMDCSIPGLPVHHQLPEFTQTHVHWVSDAIQPSYPLLSPSSPAFNLSQHQIFPMSQFFASAGQSIGVSASASVLPMNIQDWCPLGWTGWISLQSKGLSRVISNKYHSSKASILQCPAFFRVQLSHLYMTTGKTILTN